MKAMILAGGLSTRLYPLTRLVPKPLVPIAGEPNAAHLMRYLKSHGIEDVALNVFYLADKITEAFGDGSQYGVNLSYLHEVALSGSAGAVKQMEHFFTETFVIVGCDALTNIDLTKLIAFHREKKSMATIALYPADEVDQYGVVVLDDDGRVKEFQEKPAAGEERSKLVNTGVYIFEPEIFKFIEAGGFADFGHDVFPSLLEANVPFHALEMTGAYWADIGTPSEFRRATEDVLCGRIIPAGARHVGVPLSAMVANGVEITGDVRLGEKSRIGVGAKIVGPSVIGDNVIIEPGAIIERSIVFDRARVGAGAQLRNTIVGLQYDVPAATHLIEKVVGYDVLPITIGA
jgi:NDP-sugar pyrophosphorylase family protein